MNKTVVTAVAAFLMGGVTTGVLLAQAQQPGPPPGSPTGAPPGLPGALPPGPPPGPMGRGGWMGRGQASGWGDQMRERHARRMEMMRVFALIPRPEDRKLTPPDVQKIVEGFLLWNGNHSWKVINVKTEGDVIGFDLATSENSVIAHFTMDPKTGRPARPT
jgi:hypothetical protein